MPALLAVLGVFALILVLARVRVPLALAILAGSVALALVAGLDAGATLRALLQGLVRDRTLGLFVVTGLQVLLSSVLEAGGGMTRIVEDCRALLRRASTAMAALPALIGLLPMPGGALFSAPMVAAAASGAEVPGARLSAINYWFRHVWEYWWPLYPGVILAVGLTAVPWPRLAAAQAPLSLVMLASGLVLLWRLPPALRQKGPAAPAGTARRLVSATLPIWIIPLVVAALGPLLRAFILPHAGAAGPPLLQFGPIGAGLLVAVVIAASRARLGARRLAGLLRNPTQWTLPALVASVMVFQSVLEQVEMAPRVAEELARFHVPVLGVVMALPFVAGAVTGIAVGFVGTSFPIVLPLAAGIAGEGSIIPLAALAYAFGHLGQMASPLHLCQVLSNRFFGTDYGPVYRLLGPVILVGGLLAIGWSGLLRLLLW